MRRRTDSSLCLFVGLLSSAGAACSGNGQDGLVTVGVRPTVVVVPPVRTEEGGRGGLVVVPGNDEMNQVPDGNSTTTRSVAAAGAGAATAGASARVGTGTMIELPRGSSTAPSSPMAGAGGAGIAAAGASGARAATEDECGTIPSQPAGNVTSGRVSGPGLIEFDVDVPNVFNRLHTTVTVPAEPAPNGPIFIWSGLQPTPNATNFQPIGNGGLMPVLTWGSSCAPGAPMSYSTWWIAPIYSNLSSTDPNYSGCHAGKVVSAKPKQLIDIDVRLEGTTWVQKIVNRDTMDATDFSIDLKGQEQGRVFFDIELQTSNKPTEDIVFTNTVLSMDMADANACQPAMRGMNDFASKPRVSADGKHCCIDRIVLRASGVAATTMDPP